MQPRQEPAVSDDDPDKDGAVRSSVARMLAGSGSGSGGGPGGMSSPTAARFEFRVWAERLDAVCDRIRSLSECREVRETAETYFVPTSAVDVNTKARADLLDIKVLVGVRDGFEQWDVHRKLGFPVDAALLEAELFRLFELTPPTLERDAYSLTQLVDEVVGSEPDLAAVEVSKRRQMHEINSCGAEIADVTIAGHDVQTVAVESADLDAVREARRMLELDEYDNVSYPRAIRNTLGGRFAGS
jgi:hypothetical protein